MDRKADILLCGTGYFSEIILGDIAATSRAPLRVVVGGRNPERMKWLVDACRARAANYGTEVVFDSVSLDYASPETLAEPLAKLRPRVVVQSASMQSPWRVDNGESAWSDLVAEAGFGTTIAFHALLAFRMASAIEATGTGCHFVNTCYPDGVNQLLAAAGKPLTTGVGNVGLFPAFISGRLPFDQRPHLRVLAHHRHIVEWRKPVGTRAGAPVRAWIGDEEIADTEALTRDIQLPYRDLNVVSGASAVPVLLGLSGQGRRRAHVPGPGGRPGGYPVTVDEAGVSLDLPEPIGEVEAIAWNCQFEDADGVSVTDGRVVYAERTQAALRKHSPAIAEGFAVGDVEAAAAELGELRERLSG